MQNYKIFSNKRYFLILFSLALFFSIVNFCKADVTANLIGYWPFNEGTGYATNDMVATTTPHHGVFAGSPTWVSPGKLGNSSLSFTTGNDRVQVGPLDPGSVFTLSAWVKPNNSGLNDYNTIFAYSSNHAWYVRSTGKLDYYFGGSHLSNGTVTAGQWNHVVMVVDGANSKFYINGVADSATFTPTQAFILWNLGSDGVLNEGFKGVLDDMRIYNKALNQTEVNEVMNFGSITAPGLGSLSATSIASSSVTLNATVSSDNGASTTVTGFEYGTTISYGNIKSSNNTRGTGESFLENITNLTCETLYHYRAFATNSAGTASSTDSTFTTGTCPDITNPTAPSNLTFSNVASTSITISWNASTDNIALGGYKVYINNSLSTTTSSTTLTYTKNLLTRATLYTFIIEAFDTSNNVATSSLATTTLPAIVNISNPVILNISTSSATFTATIQDKNGASTTYTGFEYGIAYAYDHIATTTNIKGDGESFSESVTGLICETTYYARPIARNIVGLATGNGVSFTTGICPDIVAPSIPAGLTFSNVSSTSITISWNASTDNFGVAGYRIYIDNVLASTTASTTLSYTKSLLERAKSYTFLINVYDDANNSATSTGASTSTLPTISILLSPNSGTITDTTAVLTDNISDDGGASTTITGFEYGNTNSYGTIVFSNNIRGTNESFSESLSGLTCATTYYYRAFATNPAGTASSSENSFITNACPVQVIHSSGGSRRITSNNTNTANVVDSIVNIFTGNNEDNTPLNTEIELPPVTNEPVASLNDKWNLIPNSLIDNFVLAPLPEDVTNLAIKFPELNKVFTNLGINNLADLDRLQNVSIDLPKISDDLKNLPTEIVFAKSSQGNIVLGSTININKGGDIQQKVNTLPSKEIVLEVRPEAPAENVSGYLSFKSNNKKAVMSVPLYSNMASAILSVLPSSKTVKEEVKIEDKLLVNSFEYTDPDKDGVYTAKIKTPATEGDYEIITVIKYKDKKYGSKELRLLTVVDPEGYVYTDVNGGELRVSDAKVSIYSVGKSGNELWNASKYAQVNPQITDKTGKYAFLVPEGEYYIEVQAENYENYRSDNFNIKEGKEVHFNIKMNKKSSSLSSLIDWKMIVILVLGIALIVNFINDQKLRKKLIN